MQILRRDIHLPEEMNVDVSKLTDYPPRLLIYTIQHANDQSPPELQVSGLDIQHSFVLPSKFHIGIIK